MQTVNIKVTSPVHVLAYVRVSKLVCYHNAIMFCVNFTFVNFASADGIAKKNIAIIKFVGVALDRCG